MFQNPQFIYLIPLLLVVLTLLYINSRRKRKQRVKQLTQIHVENSPHRNHSFVKSRIKIALTLLGFLFLMIALAQPQFGFEWKEQRKQTRNLLILLDISKSMLVEDIYPNRLERSKLIIREIIESEAETSIGLLVFAGDAFLQCPITEDHTALLESLKQQTPDLIFKQGSNFSKALMTLPDIIGNPETDTAILISDGEDHSHLIHNSIQYLKNQKIRLQTICVGTPKGGLIPNSSNQNEPYFYDPHGNVVFSKANPNHMRSIAEQLNCKSIHYDTENYSFRKLNQLLAEDRPSHTKLHTQRKIPVDYFQIPLLLAFLLFSLEMAMGTRKAEHTGK